MSENIFESIKYCHLHLMEKHRCRAHTERRTETIYIHPVCVFTVQLKLIFEISTVHRCQYEKLLSRRYSSTARMKHITLHFSYAVVYIARHRLIGWYGKYSIVVDDINKGTEKKKLRKWILVICLHITPQTTIHFSSANKYSFNHVLVCSVMFITAKRHSKIPKKAMIHAEMMIQCKNWSNISRETQ